MGYCKCVTTSSPPPSTLCNNNCIIGGKHLVLPKDSVGNCGQIGQVDLGALKINTQNNTVCGQSVFFRIEDFDKDAFETVSISGNILTYIFRSEAKVTHTYKVQGRTICPASGQSDFFEVIIGVKDVCALVNCSNGFECNTCTGECETATADISTT